MKRKSNGIKEKERRKGRGTAHTDKKEKEKRKKRMGAPAPFVHDFVLAITPFICISPHLFSEKPPPRGCRYCWPNHVKYCVYCRVFSPSSLCLVGLSHSIGLPLCPNSLLKRFRTYPFATRVF